MSDSGITWSQIVTEMTSRFTVSNVDQPQISAERIASEASGYSLSELLLNGNELVTQRMMARVDSMAARRDGGEPLQYVVGSWGFRTLDVMVDRRVLIPRPETEEVAGWAMSEVDRISNQSEVANQPVVVADLGTGSGVIGLSVAVERTAVEVLLADRSADAIAVARANTAGVGTSASRVTGLYQGDWFDALPSSYKGRLGVVVSNPPYVSEEEVLPPHVDRWEPREALRATDEGFADVRHLIESAGEWLCANGALVIEMAPHQTNRAEELARHCFVEVEVATDFAGLSRAVLARKPL